MSPQAVYGTIVLIALGLNIYTAIDVRATPAAIFEAVGRRRGWWSALCFAGAFLALIGIGIAVYYLARVRPQLRQELQRRGETRLVSTGVKVTHYLLPALCLAAAVVISAHSAGH